MRYCGQERRCLWWSRILHQAVEWIRENCDATGIYLEAQQYAIGFYEKEGFQVTSDPFLEDGIPHVQMRLRLVD